MGEDDTESRGDASELSALSADLGRQQAALQKLLKQKERQVQEEARRWVGVGRLLGEAGGPAMDS